MTEHICPDCNHPVSEHKEFFCQHVYCRCNMGNVAAEAKYKLKVAEDALKKIAERNEHNESEWAKEALKIMEE